MDLWGRLSNPNETVETLAGQGSRASRSARDTSGEGPNRASDPSVDAQSEALAVVHAELILIHPFREGNGRCARVLATLMALQSDLPPLDFSGIEGKEKRRYIAAIHTAMGRDYEPMQEIFRRIIARTFRAALAKR